MITGRTYRNASIITFILYTVAAITFYIIEPKSKYSLLNFTGAAYFFGIFTLARLTYFIPLNGYQNLLPIIPALLLIWNGVSANFNDGLFYSIFCGLSILIDLGMFYSSTKASYTKGNLPKS